MNSGLVRRLKGIIRDLILTPLRCHPYLRYWKKMFMGASGVFHPHERTSLRAMLIMKSHVLEKGLSMPDFRCGFGQPMVLGLITDLFNYESGFKHDPAFESAVRVVNEYVDVHRALNYCFPEAVETHLSRFRQHFGDLSQEEPRMGKKAFFSHRQDEFPGFAASRHCCRHFCGAVSIDRLKEAVRLTNSITPSACNRQPVRTYLLDDYDKVQKILELQGGCRGFKENIRQIIIITVDLGYTIVFREYHDIYLNAGLYIMNLAYALHRQEIGHCFLTWSVTPENDKSARSISGIPRSEVLVHILAVGEIPENIVLALSKKDFGRELKVI